MKHSVLAVISAYNVTKDYPEAEKVAFYHELQRAINMVKAK